MSRAYLELTTIARSLARPDFVQGGGGNLSVKLDKIWMLIKSSGVGFKEVKMGQGLARVNYKQLSQGFIKTKENFLLACTHKEDRIKEIRPSMEAWFHVFLDRYVIHTHSVYTNIAACSKEGKEVAHQVFKKLRLRWAWIPYSTPGLELAREMAIILSDYEELPEVFLLENHGLIVSTKNYPQGLKLHRQVNGAFKNFFGIKTPYPAGPDYIKTLLKTKNHYFDEFNETILFPDQFVYSDGVFLNPTEADLTYRRLSKRAAQTFKEILVAYLYLRENILRLGYTLRSLGRHRTRELKTMEAEKYRQELLLKP